MHVFWRFWNQSMHRVTALYTGLLGALFFLLSINVSRLRASFGVANGDGGKPLLAKAIRVRTTFYAVLRSYIHCNVFSCQHCDACWSFSEGTPGLLCASAGNGHRYVSAPQSRPTVPSPQAFCIPFCFHRDCNFHFVNGAVRMPCRLCPRQLH